MDDLPTEYDEIIIGTGLQESILGAGLARIGRAVLQIDRNEYYGGDWATFNLNGLETWIESNRQNESNDNDDVMSVSADLLEDGERIVYLPRYGDTVSNLEVQWFVCEGEPVPERRRLFNRLPETPPVSPDLPGDGAPPEDNDDSQQVPVPQEGANLPEEPVANMAEPQSSDVPTTADQSNELENVEESVGSSSNADVSSAHPEDTNDASDAEALAKDAAKESAPVAPTQDAAKEPAAAAPTQDAASETVDPVPQESPAVEAAAEEPAAEEPAAVDGVSDANEINEPRKQWTQNLIKHEWRKFNIDLSPKLMFCRGSLIEALIESRVSRYAEFKAITRTLTFINGKIEKVPCSRADVFSSKYVTMLEKRILMKFIEFCLHYQERQLEYEEYLNKPFVEFLKFKKLTSTLQHFVIHSIAMVTQDTLTEDGLKATHHFLKSLGRYGNTAFLWTLYGSGELPQCFCRMCAVFNGIYMLRCTGKGLIVDAENKCKGIISSDGRRLISKNIIMDHSYRPSLASAATTSLVSRAVFMTDRSIWPTGQEEISLLTVPPLEGSPQTIQVIELPYGTYACPKDLFIIHLTCRSHHKTAKEDFQQVCKLLFQPTDSEDDANCTKPRIIWSMYFNMVDMTGVEEEELKEGLPGNTEVTSGPGCSIGYEHAVQQAKSIFERLCPGEDFLPAVPDPDDIIIENQSHDNPGHKPGFEDNASEKSENNEESKTPQNEDIKTPENEDVNKENKENPQDESGDKTDTGTIEGMTEELNIEEKKENTSENNTEKECENTLDKNS